FYIFKFVAGGDLKLYLALLPSINSEYVFTTILLIGLFGGGVVLVSLVYGACKGNLRKYQGLPYGAAITPAFLIGSAASI
ncbi:hypothetical protein ACPV5V_24030, partial [Vibrio campbellii]